MVEINGPHYVHYSRLKIISGDEAELLLASFELRDKNITDSNEYQKFLKYERKQAYRILNDALLAGDLKFFCNGEHNPCVTDGIGNEYYMLSDISIKTETFCMWATELNFNIPEILQKCKKDSGGDVAIVTPETQSAKSIPEPKIPDTKNMGGKPKGYLSEVVEYVYQMLREYGKSDLSKPTKIREFIIFIKEMTSQNSRYFDEFVNERIKSIQIPEEGDCTITTEDNVSIRGQNETILRGKSYKNNDVAKTLSKLRKNNQIVR